VTASSLTDLQLAVMKALWTIGEGSVADVLAAMADDGKALAPTTVATLLQRLSGQGWVEYDKRGRHFVYRARVERQEAASGALSRVVRAFFGGSVSALTAQLLESEQLSHEELEEMRSLLAKKEP
jgi:predicted transcriptional regulator